MDGDDRPTAQAGPALAHGLRDACDCHAHLFGPQGRYPFAADRRYTPADATLDGYRAEMRALGIERAVLTAPSVHGLDNSALLAGLEAGGPALRGITMVTPDVTDAELRRQHRLGVRGIRTQLKPGSAKPLDIPQLRAIAERVGDMGWHVEIHLDVGAMPDTPALLGDFPTAVVIEHMGHMPVGFGLGHPGFQALLRLLGAGGAWVKLSGAYINSAAPPPHRDVRPYLEALLAAAPDRAVWGSNWPHPHQHPVPNAAGLLAATLDWIGPAAARAVMVDNPARLYGFDDQKDDVR